MKTGRKANCKISNDFYIPFSSGTVSESPVEQETAERLNDRMKIVGQSRSARNGTRTHKNRRVRK